MMIIDHPTPNQKIQESRNIPFFSMVGGQIIITPCGNFFAVKCANLLCCCDGLCDVKHCTAMSDDRSFIIILTHYTLPFISDDINESKVEMK